MNESLPEYTNIDRHQQCDVIIVGAGIVGLATAMALLQRRRCSVVVLESEQALALHQSGRNSGVIHSGIYYCPGSLKARLCRTGSELMYTFCRENSVPVERCGKVIVAVNALELPALHKLRQRAQENGLDGVQWLNGDEIRKIEPFARGVAALYVPQTGIVDFAEVTKKFAEVVRSLGGNIHFNTPLKKACQDGSKLVVETESTTWRCQLLINCTGLHADRVAKDCGASIDVRILPFRGEYLEIIPGKRSLVRHLIYPVPDPELPFLGVHLTRKMDGTVEAGPNAVLSFSRHGYRKGAVCARDLFEIIRYRGAWRMAGRYWRTGFDEWQRSINRQAFASCVRRLVPEIRQSDLKLGRTGVRAVAVASDGRLLDDFHIVQQPNQIHVLNAPSPAATASISIGRYIAHQAMQALDSSGYRTDR